MKFKGLTDTEDYHWETLLWCMWYGEYYFEFTPDEWHVKAIYDWYDGPFWVLWIGPFYMVLSS